MIDGTILETVANIADDKVCQPNSLEQLAVVMKEVRITAPFKQSRKTTGDES